MRNIIKYILIFFIYSFTIQSLFADDDRNDFVSWEKPRISSVYNQSDKKLVFLVQFKTQDYTDQVYKYDFKITTWERSKSCKWDFIIAETTIYTVCWILISNIESLDLEHSIYLEARDSVTNNKETEFYKYFNKWVIQKAIDSNKSEKEISEKNLDSEGSSSKIIQPSAVKSNNWELSKVEIQLHKKLNIFFTKIENYSYERKLKIINKVLEKLTEVRTSNSEKLKIIELIRQRFLEEKKILQ